MIIMILIAMTATTTYAAIRSHVASSQCRRNLNISCPPFRRFLSAERKSSGVHFKSRTLIYSIPRWRGVAIVGTVYKLGTEKTIAT